MINDYTSREMKVTRCVLQSTLCSSERVCRCRIVERWQFTVTMKFGQDAISVIGIIIWVEVIYFCIINSETMYKSDIIDSMVVPRNQGYAKQ